MMNYNNNYNPTPWLNSQASFQQYGTQVPSFTTTFVSDIAEAIATKPDVTGKPLFFYNKANEEIYLKQYDNTGIAPVKTYKLVVETNEPVVNPVVESIKSLDEKLNEIKTILTTPVVNNIEENDRRNRR